MPFSLLGFLPVIYQCCFMFSLTLKENGEVIGLIFLRDAPNQWTLMAPNSYDSIICLNDLQCNPSQKSLHPHSKCCLKSSFYPGTVTHDSAWLADFLNQISSHTSPIESLWGQETCCNPFSPSGTYSFAFLMKRYIVSVSEMHFLVGGEEQKGSVVDKNKRASWHWAPKGKK